MEKLNLSAIHLFNGLDGAPGELPTDQGVFPALRLAITVRRVSKDGEQEFQLPDLWMTPATAMDFATAIHSSLWRFFPDQALALGLTRPTSAAGPDLHS